VQIIPNGIDLQRFGNMPKPIKLPTKSILYIGRLERRKGVKYLLEAFAVLQQTVPDAHLIIAGDGPDRQKLEQIVTDLELKGVTFKGYVTDKQKMQLLASADLFCSPAVYGESFGLVLLEAMASGLVTVAGNNSGYSAVLQEMGALSLIDPHNLSDFARRLEVMLNEEELRKVWKKWAKTYVKQFSYDKVVVQYIDLYKDAIAKHAAKNHKAV
jgi:phosphatidylinositol alpha-mannosyltransferase